jgi:hypothetical protein
VYALTPSIFKGGIRLQELEDFLQLQKCRVGPTIEKAAEDELR